MNTYETPLILFTVLSQLSIGLVAMSTIQQLVGPDPEPGRIRSEWMFACGALLTGMVASVFHLGHPGGMIRATTHLGTAWLSREALSVGLFLALVVLGLVVMREKIRLALIVVTGGIGLVVIYCMGMTYSPPSFPALNNVLPFVFFILTAILLGAGTGVIFAPDVAKPVMGKILVNGLIVGLVVYLIVPCIWLSGGEVMRQTGEQWIGSPLYWARIIIGFVLPLCVIGTLKKIPNWLWILILTGEFLGRAVFFANTVHTAANMGGLY